jgi:hypothetical protein
MKSVPKEKSMRNEKRSRKTRVPDGSGSSNARQLDASIALRTPITGIRVVATGSTQIRSVTSADALATLRNPYINNQVISIDGGIHPR